MTQTRVPVKPVCSGRRTSCYHTYLMYDCVNFMFGPLAYISIMDWRKRLWSDLSSSGFYFRSGFATSLRPIWGQPLLLVQTSFFFPHCRCIFLFLYVWIQQRVQLSWTQTGTLGRRQTASLSWPFTPTQTAVAAGVEVWETVTPTARGAQGVRRTHTPTDSLSCRLMVLPSPRRMTSNLYSRWMTPVLCVKDCTKNLCIQ